MKLITILGATGVIASTGGRLQGLSWGHIMFNITVFSAITYISYRLDVRAEKRRKAARRKSRSSSTTAI